MSHEDTPGLKRPDRSDWSEAWHVVARLAVAREGALHTLAQDRRSAPVRPSNRYLASKSDPTPALADPAGKGAAEATPASAQVAASAALVATPAAPAMDPDQLALAVAEIEKASAALREAEPGLEIGLPDPMPSHRRKYWSIWLLLGAVWISAMLVVAGATGAILYLFG